MNHLPCQLSGGELQRFALLRCLLLQPVFLFADEPTSRLELITQQETLNLLLESVKKTGCDQAGSNQGGAAGGLGNKDRGEQQKVGVISLSIAENG